ncbi:unnamed protein product [Blepharisma stoltei]|uniref:Uncharacterized protein n=1 Tax=Blepharisma stoltei TaxID=1481888 RepID=A0AAU9JZN1_9CILI|nr:unnamed protein product [Blepharisma stoltei]
MKANDQITQKNKAKKQLLEQRIREHLAHKELFKRPDIVPEQRYSEKSSSFLQISENELDMEPEVLSTKGESPKADEENLLTIQSLTNKLHQEENARQDVELKYQEIKENNLKNTEKIEKLTEEIEILSREILAEREIYRGEAEKFKTALSEKDEIIDRLKKDLSQCDFTIAELEARLQSSNTSNDLQIHEIYKILEKERKKHSQELMKISKMLELEREQKFQALQSLEELKSKANSTNDFENYQNELKEAKDYIKNLQLEYQKYFKKLNKEIEEIKFQNKLLLGEIKFDDPVREENLRLQKRCIDLEENLKANNQLIENAVNKSNKEKSIQIFKEKRDLKRIIQDQIAHNADIVNQIENKLSSGEKPPKHKLIISSRSERKFFNENSADSLKIDIFDLAQEPRKEFGGSQYSTPKNFRNNPSTPSSKNLKDRCDVCFRKPHPNFEHTLKK